MNSFRLDDHTADAKLVMCGITKEDLFHQGLRGMYNFMEPENTKISAPLVNLDLHGRDTTQLLVDFLSHALTWSYVNKACYTTITINTLTDTTLVATLAGHRIECFGKDLKAVTYHKAYVKPVDNGFEAAVIFDI